MSQYLLSRHVFLCQAGTQVVFLDLRRNKYWAIDRVLSSRLDGVVSGWPVHRELRRGSATLPSGGDATIARSLLDKGLLTTRRTEGKRANRVTIGQVAEDLVSEYGPTAPVIKARHIMTFLMASATAAVMLRCMPLHQVAKRVGRAKKRGEQSAEEFDFDRARRLVEIYVALRPFLFTGKGACLLDSLALFEFLRHFGLYGTWVFGVQTDPFLAHSWLQQGCVVLNDRLVHVNLYTPILAI